ncbi:aquaporin [Nocardioides sp. R-C-SC26]|uniref:aquaporin n=1 Tax=Nocardioides sp. R-C-SC26 TaxID=2870414 RepID=UPI001E52E471|nr:aquaporin [Nocardioides sp. R-C-SC26]
MSTTAQRCLAELVGTGLLVATVVGSGISATRLTDDVGLQLLVNSLATGAVLVALILALRPVSAAFNPVITVVELALHRLDARQAIALIASQVAGGILGTLVANLMFELDVVSVAGTDRTGAGLWLGEVVATSGLVLVVLGTGHRWASPPAPESAAPGDVPVALAVGGYITAAYWFTSSTSFANPAVTVARTLSDTFTGISPASAPMFIGMQLLGGVLALALCRALSSAHDDHPVTDPADEPQELR